MRENYPRSREEWFIPHETTVTLPDGSELMVDGIPYEGWGISPGGYWSLAECDDDGNVLWTKRWST